MRIGVDLMSFRPGKMGGTETHMRSLISSLSDLDEKNEYVLLLNSRNADSVELPRKNFSKKIIHSARHSFLLRNLPVINNAPIIRAQLASLNLDLLFRPFTVSFPRVHGVPEVVVIADLQFEEFPKYFSAAQLYSRKRLYRDAVVRADAVIAISEFTKHSVISRYNVPASRVHVVYEAAGEEFFSRASENERTATLEKQGLVDGGYYYYPAAAWKHKNHESLFKAIRILADKGESPILALSGLGGDRARLHALVKSMNLSKNVVFLPRLSKTELPSLYQGAKAMLFPSLYEGFGLPLVEAMASGCPIVCGKAGSIHEICEDAALYFDPYSPPDIANKALELSSNSKLRNELITAGIKQSRKFSWKKCARETLDTFEHVSRAR